MKNKRIVISYFFGFISCLIITTVSATILYNAKDIEFTPSDSSWNVDNMQDAINDIKKDVLEKKHVIKLASLQLAYGVRYFDVSSVFDDYKQLTSANFIYSFKSATSKVDNASLQNSETPTYYKEYDPQTGKLKYGRGSYTITAVTPNVDLYVIY